MDGTTLIDILRRLPSTGDLRTMLFKPRQPQPSAVGDTKRIALNSSDLLAQIGLALALCQESPGPDLETECQGMRTM
jgi:hypothetical protein